MSNIRGGIRGNMMKRHLTLSASAMGAALLAACAPVNVLNTITPSDDFIIEKNIAYGDLEAQKLDIYTPQNPKADAPIVMFFYGGGWSDGSKDIYKFIGQSFTEAGYTVVVPTYRIYPDVIYPDFLKDAAKAVAYTEQRFDRPMILTGHSAGAHIASLMALDKRYLAAEGLTPCAVISGWVGLAGPYDFKVIEAPYLSIFPEGTRTEMLPITHAGSSPIPALMITGDADETVDYRQSQRMRAALSAGGAKAETLIVPKIGHIDAVSAMSTVLRKEDSPVRPAVMKFVSQHNRASCPAAQSNEN